MSSDALVVDVRLTRVDGARRRGGFALDASFRAEPGITILFGPSGAGKTTLLELIAGLITPDAGRIALGQEVWFDAGARVAMPVHRRHVAYVFQSLALFPHMSALGNVAFGVARDVGSRAERRRRALALLERMGVAHLAERRPRTFSGGEAQRVALARALAMSPRVVLLDEPFSALDQALREQLMDLVRDLVAEYRLPLLQVTHDREVARAMGDWVVRIRDGKVTESGTARDVLR